VARLAGAMTDADWRVRAQVASSLGMIRDPSALDALVTGLHDESWWVRQNSAQAMAELPAGRVRLREMADEGTDEIVELAHYQLALAGRGGS
jgi:HEAT repeat protein